MRNEVARIWQLGGAVVDGALARRRPQSRERLVDRLASLRGLPQKIGQTLALGALDESSSAWSRLCEAPQALAAEQATAEIERALGAPLRAHFRSFDPAGIAASLGQVHAAELRDGRRVAVKL